MDSVIYSVKDFKTFKRKLGRKYVPISVERDYLDYQLGNIIIRVNDKDEKVTFSGEKRENINSAMSKLEEELKVEFIGG